ncbi:MAG: response regulator transcription factor [Chthonomonas sp.]|nr:response regulator transcription factor [Chthonomonas sp.]
MEYFKKQLSARELDVLRLSSEGLTDKEVATKLSVSLGTIHTYWTRVRSKCNGRTRAEIVSRYTRELVGSSNGTHAGVHASILDAIPLGVIEVDADLAIGLMNATSRELLSVNGAEAPLSLNHLPVSAQDRTEILQITEAVILGKRVRSGLTSRGTRLDVVPVLDGSRAVGAIITITPSIQRVAAIWSSVSSS